MKQSKGNEAPAASRKSGCHRRSGGRGHRLSPCDALWAGRCRRRLRPAAGSTFRSSSPWSLGGGPLVLGLLVKLFRREFGSDLLAGISIVTSVLVIPREYLAGTLVVLMLSGGEALEAYAVRSASSVLAALAKRMPSAAHRKRDGQIADVPLDEVAVGDALVVFPHEICPVDGAVVEGHGAMDESYLTGEPYRMSKAPGSAVLSGAVNGETALTIRCEKPAADSRYAKIMQVMRDSEQRRPRLRRLGDQLGAWYTPLAVAIALAAWAAERRARLRFLAVLVVATPCPLLIAIPVAIIGSVSLSARRGIIIKDPAVLEKVATCRTAIFDKTGTLTYGQPHLTELLPAAGWEGRDVLALVAGLERYSKHPLAGAVLAAAEKQGVQLPEAAEVSEPPGQGLTGSVSGRSVQVTSRKKFLAAASRRGRRAAGRRPRGWNASSSSTAATPPTCGSATGRGPTAPRSSATSAAATGSTG